MRQPEWPNVLCLTIANSCHPLHFSRDRHLWSPTNDKTFGKIQARPMAYSTTLNSPQLTKVINFRKHFNLPIYLGVSEIRLLFWEVFHPPHLQKSPQFAGERRSAFTSVCMKMARLSSGSFSRISFTTIWNQST